MSQIQFLHIGCGPKRKDRTTAGFNQERWREIRLDIDPKVAPDIIGTMTDMQAVATASMDALYSSHNIEHLYPHEVATALAEFLRVLKPDGFAVITCPDLQAVAELVAQDKLNEPCYVSPAGPVTPLDILYGFRPSLAAGNLFMAHRTGFTLRSLLTECRAAGFDTVIGAREGRSAMALWVIASKCKQSEDIMRQLAAAHFPRKKV